MAEFANGLKPTPAGRLPAGLTSGWQEFSAAGYRWKVPPAYVSLLVGPQGLRLQEWLDQGQARVVKTGPHRIVYRVDLPELSFYVKHNLVPDWTTWLRQWVRPSKARMEFETTREVAARGVPTFVPLAVAERPSFVGVGDSYFLTRTLEDTEPLYVFAGRTLPAMARARQMRLRHRLAAELGRLVAQIHDAGIRHHDLHAGNILVRLGDDDQISLFLIDLNGVRLGKPLSWSSSRANLALLNRWFIVRATRTDRLRFWESYRQARRLGAGCENLHRRESRALADDLEKLTWRSNISFWQYRDRRSLKNNRYYRRVRHGKIHGHAVTDLDWATLATLLADPDAPFAAPGVKLLKDSPTSTVAELEITVNGQRRSVIYKRFRVRKWFAPFTGLVRPTPALRSWTHGQGFRERGLPTARPLAVLHRKRFGLWYEGYLLTEKIDNSQELLDFCTDIQKLRPEQRQWVIRQQIKQVAQVVRELHRRGMSHRDLKSANVLVSRDVSKFTSPFSGEAWVQADAGLQPLFASTVWLIDLVGVERHPRLSRSRKIQNLSRLNASFYQHPSLTRTDRLRFLKTYMEWNLHGGGDWKNWWHAIARATEAKVARNQRRGRPLG